MITLEQIDSLGVDSATLLDRCGGNMELINRLYSFFIESNSADQMMVAYASQDADLLEHSSHALKGSAANLGLSSLSEKAAAVCNATRTFGTANIDFALLDDALEEFKSTKRKLTSFDLT